jgi:hypothetical protein
VDKIDANIVVVSAADASDQPVSRFEVLFASGYVTEDKGVHRLALQAAKSTDVWLRAQEHSPDFLHVLLPPSDGDDYSDSEAEEEMFLSRAESKESLRGMLLSAAVKELPKTIPVQLPVNIFKGKEYQKAKDLLYLGRVRYEVVHKKITTAMIYKPKAAAVMKGKIDQLGVQIYLDTVDKACMAPAKRILADLGDQDSITSLDEFHGKITRVLTDLAIIDADLVKAGGR